MLVPRMQRARISYISLYNNKISQERQKYAVLAGKALYKGRERWKRNGFEASEAREGFSR